MPAALVEDAGRAGVRLLPSLPGLTPQCSCPDWGNPCKHAAAALYYQVARLLDADPFVLLLSARARRGRGDRRVAPAQHRPRPGHCPRRTAAGRHRGPRGAAAAARAAAGHRAGPGAGPGRPSRTGVRARSAGRHFVMGLGCEPGLCNHGGMNNQIPDTSRALSHSQQAGLSLMLGHAKGGRLKYEDTSELVSALASPGPGRAEQRRQIAGGSGRPVRAR